MGTPHNEAAQGAFAKTVLMPGDPLRAKFIAETFLQDAKLVNNVRGVQGYTGTYQGTPVSVMASGMGMPSIGIYSHELFHFYDVDNIIRVGSAGAISPQLKVRDVVFGQGSCTDSNYAHQFGLGGTFAPIADFTLLETAVTVARKLGIEPMWAPAQLRRVLQQGGQHSGLGQDGRAGCRDGERGPVLQRRRGGQAGPGHLYHLRQLDYRRGAACRRPPDHLHPDDGDRPGRCCGDGEEVRRVQKRRISPRGHAGEA